MRLESISYKDVAYFTGVSLLSNEMRLTKDELLSAVASFEEQVSAIQLMNPILIVDTHHLICAAQNALNAWLGGYAISRSLSLEIGLYASGQRQIAKALDSIGVTDDNERVAIVVIDKHKKTVKECIKSMSRLIGTESSEFIHPSKERIEAIKQHFVINNLEIETMTKSKDIESIQAALSKCVAERVSLVALET